MGNSEEPSKSREQPALKMERHFKAAPEVVFNTFTEPGAMRVWWTDNTEFDIDLRIGGQWTIKLEDSGTEYVMTGEYLKIEKPNLLQFTIGMPQFSPNRDIITIHIEPDGNSGSKMTFIQSGEDIANELRQLPKGTVSESEKGWQEGFDLMAAAWDS